MEKIRGKFVSHILYTLLYNTQHSMKQICEAASLFHFKDPQVHGIVVKSVQGEVVNGLSVVIVVNRLIVSNFYCMLTALW